MTFQPQPKAHILVVDDDDRLRKLLSRYLHEQGYTVSEAEDTEMAADNLSLLIPDVMVLDVMMPGQTGLEFMHMAQAEERELPPVLMLTAMDTPEDRIGGLESGVEDYLTKPFEPRELLLRLSNILRRFPQKLSDSPMILFGAYVYDTLQQRLSEERTGNEILLSTSERALLSALAQTPNQPQSRDFLSEALGFGENLRHVDVHVGRLRKKLGDGGLVQTVRGKGYRLVVGES